MGNRDIASARDYHERTKHSPVSIRSGPHYLDWDNQPHPFKVYEDLDSLPLEEHLASSGVPALQAIARSAPEGERGITRKELGEMLFLCAGVTRRRRYFGGEMLFRAAACTGALYHIDVYVVAGPLADLDAGVYHFAPERFALTPLRTGDHRGALVEASGGEPAVARAPAVLVFASTFWRNSWKYRDRAYRHCFWDGGTILANCLAAASARDIPARTVMGFAEVPVNRLLGLNPDKEGALCLVPLGRAASPTAPSGEDLPALDLVTRPLSRREVDYPSIREMHAASSLESGAQVRSWREGEDPNVTPAPGSSPGQALNRGPGGAEVRRWRAGGAAAANVVDAAGMDESVTAIREIPLEMAPAESLPTNSIEQVIVRRGSTRRFSHEAITFAQLSNALHHATRGVATDADPDGSRPLNQLYLIVNHVDGTAPGTYALDRERARLELLKEGEFRREAGFLGLGQEIPHDASVNVYFLADLEPVLARYGNRGYRLAQMEAAVTAGRLYLAAYAHGFGASGLTFFDDDVTGFFSPHAAGKSVMFLVALGRRLKAK
ncbi:MAG: SagB/ThcOx family dehydrogenase [Deltaproteobacteria bacterium]|nr:SagB/ThcOx family dehydrogenase [Deltaproteobacteria bacterium]